MTLAVDQSVGQRPSLRAWSRDLSVTAALLVIAAVGWWWSARTMDMHEVAPAMSDGMSMDGMDGMSGHDGMHAMSIAAFVVAWVAMMAAMMLPAVVPVVALYRRAVAAGRAAPLPYFLVGYLIVWSLPGLPVYWAWRELQSPLADGVPWAGRLAAGALLAAAAWQLSPVKSFCLRHCRSPLSFFMKHGGGLRSPAKALRLGLAHGGFCLGCCWLFMVVLIALGTMDLVWMVVIALVIFVEKVLSFGETASRVIALGFALLGGYLLIDPTSVASIT